uniref:DUF3800 domain-containing protein n=1 Tax=Panagrellus redivivus TaxID=6233 RepID=A0A7E4W4L5_PANRE
MPTVKHIKLVIINRFDAEFIKDLHAFMKNFPLVKTVQVFLDLKAANPLLHRAVRTAAITAFRKAKFKAEILVDYFVCYPDEWLKKYRDQEYDYVHEEGTDVFCWSMKGKKLHEKIHFCKKNGHLSMVMDYGVRRGRCL